MRFFSDTCVYHSFVGQLYFLHLLNIMGATIWAECTSKTWKNLLWSAKISFAYKNVELLVRESALGTVAEAWCCLDHCVGDLKLGGPAF